MGRGIRSTFPENPDPLELAWAAGLFEGEGCVTRDHRNNSRLGFALQMTDLDVMQKFCRIVGGHEPRVIVSKKQQKTIYRWTASSAAYVEAFKREIGPHLGERRRKAMDL